MSRFARYRTLVAGTLSPIAAAAIGAGVYLVLTRASQDRDRDFLFRLSLTAIAMAIPFFLTVLLAFADRRCGSLGRPSRVGLVLGALSLVLLWLPVKGAISRSKQAASLALDGVAAPELVTTDINGTSHRLSELRGKVVLLNVWATWCPPCLKEMPQLEELHRTRSDDGLVVLGLSDEDAELQRRYAEKVKVSYPLLTVEGQVPEMFREIKRYPAVFLIDRRGALRPAPGTDRPFEELAGAVDRLLAE